MTVKSSVICYKCKKSVSAESCEFVDDHPVCVKCFIKPELEDDLVNERQRSFVDDDQYTLFKY